MDPLSLFSIKSRRGRTGSMLAASSSSSTGSGTFNPSRSVALTFTRALQGHYMSPASVLELSCRNARRNARHVGRRRKHDAGYQTRFPLELYILVSILFANLLCVCTLFRFLPWA